MTLAKHIKAEDLNSQSTITPHEASKATPSATTSMNNAIQAVINDNTNIDMSVSLIDLGNGQSAHFGDSSPFTAASVEKVLTAAYFLHQVENGQESLNESIGGNSAQYELQQMIVVSDDTAWEALNNELGYNNLANYAASIGWNDYGATANTLSTNDMALLLAKLWGGTLLNKSDTGLLLKFMKAANYRDYMVPAVPAGDTIYHKVGLYDDDVNEATVITNGHQSFAIVIFTDGNGTYDWTTRAKLMQDITRAAIKVYL